MSDSDEQLVKRIRRDPSILRRLPTALLTQLAINYLTISDILRLCPVSEMNEWCSGYNKDLWIQIFRRSMLSILQEDPEYEAQLHIQYAFDTNIDLLSLPDQINMFTRNTRIVQTEDGQQEIYEVHSLLNNYQETANTLIGLEGMWRNWAVSILTVYNAVLRPIEREVQIILTHTEEPNVTRFTFRRSSGGFRVRPSRYNRNTRETRNFFPLVAELFNSVDGLNLYCRISDAVLIMVTLLMRGFRVDPRTDKRGIQCIVCSNAAHFMEKLDTEKTFCGKQCQKLFY